MKNQNQVNQAGIEMINQNAVLRSKISIMQMTLSRFERGLQKAMSLDDRYSYEAMEIEINNLSQMIELYQSLIQ